MGRGLRQPSPKGRARTTKHPKLIEPRVDRACERTNVRPVEVLISNAPMVRLETFELILDQERHCWGGKLNARMAPPAVRTAMNVFSYTFRPVVLWDVQSVRVCLDRAFHKCFASVFA